MSVLAVIPARGGSKGIPRKNIVNLAGKPMIAHSIEVALASTQISRVVVSTDSEEIAAVARAYGAEVPFLRPGEIAQDDSTDLSVFQHFLDAAEEAESYLPEIVVHLRPTCPVRRASTVDSALEKFRSVPEASALRSVSVAHQTPFKMWFLDSETRMHPALMLPRVAEPYNQPRQALPIAYWQNGYIDITKPTTIRDHRSMTGPHIVPFVVREPIFDVDYLSTLQAAEDYLSGRSSDIELDHLPG